MGTVMGKMPLRVSVSLRDGESVSRFCLLWMRHTATCRVFAPQLITDELIHELVRTDGLRVTAASSVVAEPRDIPAIARKLDVQIVFDGTVRQNQNQLRVMSRIINADGFQIWSERFETEPDPQNLFKLAERIASALVSRIRTGGWK
jgi:TolB-like protein